LAGELVRVTCSDTETIAEDSAQQGKMHGARPFWWMAQQKVDRDQAMLYVRR
jgi:hypothetical protein